jgi:ABC-type multidrug transport system ATPase subunit
MSSHVLSEVERVCDRIGLLRRGELVLVSSVSDVRNLAARQIRVLFREDVPTGPVAARDRLPENCELIETTARTWTVRVRGAMGPLLSSLGTLPVEDIEVREPHLEEVLKTYYKDEVSS